MEQILAQPASALAPGKPRTGFLAEAPSAALDAFVHLLAALTGAPHLPPGAPLTLLAGLHALRAALALPAAPPCAGSWSFTLDSHGPAGTILSLTRDTPPAALTFQLDRDGMPHGAFHLHCADHEDLFHFQQQGSQWILHACNPSRRYPVEFPPGAALSWQTDPVRDFWDQLLPASTGIALSKWAATLAAPSAPVPPLSPPMPQGMSAPPIHPVAPPAASVPPVTPPQVQTPPPPSAAICARCAAPLAPGARFCGRCRSPVAPPTQQNQGCPACGTPAPAHARFCGHCRRRL